MQERCGPRVVAGIRHHFTVTLRQAYRLPSPAAYAEAHLLAPDVRFVRYCFPGAQLGSATSLSLLRLHAC